MSPRRRSGVKIEGELSKFTDDRIAEVRKCMDDIIYFAENYVKILHPTKGFGLVKLYDCEKRIIRALCNERFILLNASRQIGKTTSAKIYILWLVTFHKDVSCAILANNQRRAATILAEIKQMYEILPDWMKPGVRYDAYNRLQVKFDNNCKIIVGATSLGAIRGEGITVLFLDEFAWVPSQIADEFWSANYPTISEGGQIAIASTHSGPSGKFYELCEAAKIGANNFTYIEIPWYEHPERDNKWREMVIDDIGPIVFEREYNCQALGSTTTLISATTLANMVPETPIWESSVSDRFTERVFADPIPNRLYLMALDPAAGTGRSESVIKIFDYTEIPIVEVYSFADSLINTSDFKAQVLQMGRMYNNAYIFCENNGLGQAIVTPLWNEDGYENMYINKAGNPGIASTVARKREACIRLKDALEHNKMLIRDSDTIAQLGKFVEHDGTFRAQHKSDRDDLVMASAWAAWAMKEEQWQQIVMRAKEQMKKVKMDPLHQVIAGVKNKSFAERMRDEHEELTRWLLS